MTWKRYDCYKTRSDYSRHCAIHLSEKEASPVLWYGRPVPNQWLTIGTNPSRGECLHRDGILRTGQTQKFYWRETLSFEDYLGNEEALQQTLERVSQ